MKARTRSCIALVASTLISLSMAAPARAAGQPPGPPDLTIDLPAGLACPGFDLRIELWGPPNRVNKDFKDKNGNVVRILGAGKGNALALTNLANNKSYFVAGTGSVQHTVVNADGTQIVSNTGHNVIVFFPTDIPAGPTTKQYIGKIVYSVDLFGNFTLQSAQGREFDICAAIN